MVFSNKAMVINRQLVAGIAPYLFIFVDFDKKKKKCPAKCSPWEAETRIF